jgi:hypothetical protein
MTKTTKAQIIDDAIKVVAEAFAEELQRLRMKGDRDNGYGEDKLELTVTRDNGKNTFELAYARGYGNNVKGSDIGVLMYEVYRREGFDEREIGRLEEASRALAALPRTDENVDEDAGKIEGPLAAEDEIPY